MQNYKEIILENRASSYIKKHISYGLTLSKYVLEFVNLSAGQVTTGVPENANMKVINNFDNAGLLPTAPKSTWQIIEKEDKRYTAVPVSVDFSYVFDTISSFLNSGENKVCVFENRNAKTPELSLRCYPSRVWTLRNEVYQVLNGGIHSNEEIERIIRESRSLWTFVGYLTSFPEDKQDFTQPEVTDELLLILAKRVEKIIAGAYDGEGFLIWHKMHETL